MKRLSTVLVLFLVLVQQAHSIFYLPGVAPQEFGYGKPVELKVNKLTSVHTQLPYKYYSLPFCRPTKIQDKVENLGEILRGDRIENSMYEVKHVCGFLSDTLQINAKIPVSCKVLCLKNYTKSQVKDFSEKVGYEYRVHWLVTIFEKLLMYSGLWTIFLLPHQRFFKMQREKRPLFMKVVSSLVLKEKKATRKLLTTFTTIITLSYCIMRIHKRTKV